MKGNFKRFIALAVLTIFCSVSFAGCSLFRFEEYKPNYFEEGYVEPDYDFKVSCSDKETTITLGGIGEYGEFANLVYARPYEYLSDEAVKGAAEIKNATPTFVEKYECGTEATITINRIEESGYDTVYCKFYCIDENGHILAGPIFPTEIEPIFDHEPLITAKGIKGIMVNNATNINFVKDLGCEYAQVGCWMGGIIVPLETVNEETGEITPIEYSEDLDENGKGYIQGPYGNRQAVEAFYHNGKKFYFRTAAWGGYQNLDFYDNAIKTYSNANIKVTLLLLMLLDVDQNKTNPNFQYVQPYFLCYKEARYKSAGMHAINTANPYGAEYWAAFTEFIARRYSDPSGEHGTVESYVLGNEIDQSLQWNCLRDLELYPRLSTEDYVTEYERTLRIANQSFKKVYARDIALVPITHWWNANGGGSDYNPKDIVDILCTRTRSQGNYNWGLAIHPYGETLTVTNFWSNDVASTNGINGTFETRQITWTNLEVLQLYLEQELKMFDGKVRDVYVTEGGVSTAATPTGSNIRDKDKLQQAAGIAYAYYKASQLSCIKALNYYRLIDCAAEGARFGLLTEVEFYKKPSYYMYKDIDTEKSWEATKDYIQYMTWIIFENGKNTPHGYGIDIYDIDPPDVQWHKTMNIVKSNFDWEANWNLDKIMARKTT